MADRLNPPIDPRRVSILNPPPLPYPDGTAVYMRVFDDGAAYVGITDQPPVIRWAQQEIADTPLGRKLRTARPRNHVLAVIADRAEAERIEQAMIRAVAVGGQSLNVQHSPRTGEYSFPGFESNYAASAAEGRKQ